MTTQMNDPGAPPAREFLFGGVDVAGQNEGAVPVRTMAPRAKVSTGKPRRIAMGNQRSKVAFPSAGGMSSGIGSNPYSYGLSTDFLQLPQDVNAQRQLYRDYFLGEPFISQAIRIHGELPLSKLRLGMPRAADRKLAERAMRFCQKWADEIGLLHRLLEIVHEYFLIGEAYVFAEDASPDMPREVTHDQIREVTVEGTLRERWEERPDAEDRAKAWLKKNYMGWTALRVLPPETVTMEAFQFADDKLFELIPDPRTRAQVELADAGDPRALRMVSKMPRDVVDALRSGENIPLGTDPNAGSFIHWLANKKSQYDTRGHSILEPCLKTLLFRDKLRQSQSSIADRHMTPMRLIWAADMDAEATEELRAQVDWALQDPDYSIITNFQVNWEEMSSDQRLLDLTSEYDLTDRQLYAGLGVTEGLLSGESSYSGDRMNLEVINTRYMLLREVLQDYVEKSLFRPMCAKMGFFEIDEDGDTVVVHPTLTFTRLALRDNSDTFDALFNLYQKGSLDIDVILDLLNIDPITTREKLERDMFTLQDSTYNELLRSANTDMGQKLVEQTNLLEIVVKRLSEAGLTGLVYTPPKEDGGGRFG